MTDNPARLVVEGVEKSLSIAMSWHAMAGPAAWDAPREPAWTLREIAEHVSGVTACAEFAGNLR